MPDSSQVKRAVGYRVARIAGIALLALWVAWWTASLLVGRLFFDGSTWNGYPWPHLGLDFLHTWAAEHALAAGQNPYLMALPDPLHRPYAYAPVNLAFFLWTIPLVPAKAIILWDVILAAIVVVAAHACLHVRRDLGLTPIPWAAGVAVPLWSFPVVFAMERGNTDLLVVLLILASVRLGKTPASWASLAAGAVLGLAALLKLYAGLLLAALLLARRRLAAVGLCAGVALLVLATFPWTVQWLSRGLPAFFRWTGNGVSAGRHTQLVTYVHALSAGWDQLMALTGTGALAGRLSLVLATVVLLALLAWVGLAVGRAGDARRREVELPFLLWTAALATFVPSNSYDYNLVFLPLAVLAVWDARDGWLAQLALFFGALVLQPFRLPLSGNVVLPLKLLVLLAVGRALVSRCVATLPGETRAHLINPDRALAERGAPDARRDEGAPGAAAAGRGAGPSG
jgi:Glycosyltransferase family 87